MGKQISPSTNVGIILFKKREMLIFNSSLKHLKTINPFEDKIEDHLSSLRPFDYGLIVIDESYLQESKTILPTGISKLFKNITAKNKDRFRFITALVGNENNQVAIKNLFVPLFPLPIESIQSSTNKKTIDEVKRSIEKVIHKLYHKKAGQIKRNIISSVKALRELVVKEDQKRTIANNIQFYSLLSYPINSYQLSLVKHFEPKMIVDATEGKADMIIITPIYMDLTALVQLEILKLGSYYSKKLTDLLKMKNKKLDTVMLMINLNVDAQTTKIIQSWTEKDFETFHNTIMSKINTYHLLDNINNIKFQIINLIPEKSKEPLTIIKIRDFNEKDEKTLFYGNMKETFARINRDIDNNVINNITRKISSYALHSWIKNKITNTYKTTQKKVIKNKKPVSTYKYNKSKHLVKLTLDLSLLLNVKDIITHRNKIAEAIIERLSCLEPLKHIMPKAMEPTDIVSDILLHRDIFFKFTPEEIKAGKADALLYKHASFIKKKYLSQKWVRREVDSVLTK